MRLVDATGQPIEKANSPRDDFEKAAVRELKADKAWPEQIVEKDGARHLRAATPIPVVLKKCVMCHAHYEKAAKGEPIGVELYAADRVIPDQVIPAWRESPARRPE